VHNLDYPSRTVSLPELGERWLPERLRELEVDRAPRLHFVTHSMGALIVRRYLATRRPANLGRVVMIAPPNRGSAVADHLRRWRLFHWCIGRNLAVLGTAPDSFWRSLPPRADYELGVIAGCRALNPFGRFWLERPHDGTVAVASTLLEGQSDHLLLPANHTGILLRRDTAVQVVAFLRTGRFGR
jgi:triacylglycerol lipase